MRILPSQFFFANVFRRNILISTPLIRRPLVSYSKAAAMSSATMNTTTAAESGTRQTRILPVDASKLGSISIVKSQEPMLDLNDWDINLDEQDLGVQYLRLAAEELRTGNVPVAFPTETVYGLGADATRSDAVIGIYKAKQRPSDNPLIVHFANLKHLRNLLGDGEIPPIYMPLIERFWPGPLTIVLPNPAGSPLAPEVTAGLNTFGARIPKNLLALLLIQLSGKPIAAPSANASTKPSPTAAEHVMEDLQGRIDYIIDGGPCDVGVESTVVDGLSTPPAILRPGGISAEQLRECPGWENVVLGYEDVSLKSGAPRAPGMKYRHYSPKAKVILFEVGMPCGNILELAKRERIVKVGIIRTNEWIEPQLRRSSRQNNGDRNLEMADSNGHSVWKALIPAKRPEVNITPLEDSDQACTEYSISTTEIAQDLFWALRELDRLGCGAICVEGIRDDGGDVAAAVMNRLRKAAEVHVGR